MATKKRTAAKTKVASAATKAAVKKVSAEALPRLALPEVIIVAQKLNEIYAGQSATWEEIADKTDSGTGTSNKFKYTMWSALAYGVILKAEDKKFALSETGRKIVAETYPGESKEAKLKAVLTPTTLSKFFTFYNGKSIPADEHISNVLETRFDVPRDRTQEALGIIRENGTYAGILEEQADGKPPIVRIGGIPVAASSSDGPEEVSAVVSVATKGSWDSICFYITPIGEEDTDVRKHADLMLKHILKPVLSTFDIEVVRADAITRSGIITQQIFEHLAKARLCVADLSFGNPNAFYELGVRHVCQLPTIQIIQKGDKIPFDVSQGRTIIVDTSDRYTVADRLESARRELTEHVKNLLAVKTDVKAEDNPIAVYLPDLKVVLPK